MVLGFKEYFPWGDPTYFREKIWASTNPAGIPISPTERFIPKIHTIRENKTDRWGIGATIHAAYGSRTKNYNCFHKLECKSIQKIRIYREGVIVVDGRTLSKSEIETLAKNDGFDNIYDFWRWFGKTDFDGVIIHWTNYRY